jgi:hypothetical protein
MWSGTDVAVIGELLPAKRAFAALQSDFAVHQLPDFRVRTEFPIPSRMMRIVDAADTNPVGAPLFRDRFPTAAKA